MECNSGFVKESYRCIVNVTSNFPPFFKIRIVDKWG